MEREIESERIGLIGESQFQLLCAQSGLICNKSTVDVMGWDFVVEFPAERAGDGVTLDQRQARAVRVQLKSTVGRKNSRVRLSLSSVDRLAEGCTPLRHRRLPHKSRRQAPIWLFGASHR